MAKTKISEFSSTAADNTDITNINIAEGCSPANVNNAIRSLMSLLKNQQDGSSGDPFTVASTLVSSGTLDVTGAFRLDGTAGASGQALVSAGGANTPTWSTLGTMASQSASAVAITGGTITGGTITGITDLTVADGGTGASTITANSVILGNGASTLSGNLVAPSTSGNVLTSNGTTWTSAAPATPFSWVVSNVSSSSSITSGVTSYSITSNTIMVLGTAYSYMGGGAGASLGVRIKDSGGSTLFTYTLTGANENNGGDGGSGMSARSAWSVAVPSAAIGGTLEFFRVSGSASVELTINQVVKSA